MYVHSMNTHTQHIYIYIYIYIYKHVNKRNKKIDLGIQSFMQNTFTIFSQTMFNVQTLKITL